MSLCQVRALWFCPGLMDHLEPTACPFLEVRRTNVTKVTMATFSIVKTLEVFEYTGSSFFFLRCPPNQGRTSLVLPRFNGQFRKDRLSAFRTPPD